jgi:hypothetical protein
MKLRTLTALLAFTITGQVAAQQTAAEVSDAQVAEYKALAAKSCKDAGEQRGDPEANVTAFCGCLIQVLDKNMTAAEWRQAYLFSRKNQAEEESKLFAPHMAKSAVCRAQP